MNLPSNLFLLISTSSLGIKKLKYILQSLIVSLFIEWFLLSGLHFLVADWQYGSRCSEFVAIDSESCRFVWNDGAIGLFNVTQGHRFLYIEAACSIFCGASSDARHMYIAVEILSVRLSVTPVIQAQTLSVSKYSNVQCRDYKD